MKKLLKRMLIILAYWCGVDAIFFWLNRHAKRIIVFHNVLRDDLYDSGPSNTTSIPLREFSKVIDCCCRMMPISVNVEDPKTLTITFDDGYRNQYSTAFRYLEARSIPAILFNTSKIGDGLPIDKAVLWRALVPKDKVPGENLDKFWREQFWPRFMADGKSRGQETVRWLDDLYPMEQLLSSLTQEYREERLAPLSAVQLQEMRDAGWIVGWHTISHFPLAGLAATDVVTELTPSEEFRNVVMAYPYGSDMMVGSLAPKVAEHLGFPYAMAYTNVSHLCSSRYFFPRLPYLGTDKYEIAASLSGFRHFLSFRKLLPCVVA